MMEEFRSENLTAAERDALEALPRERMPDAKLEARTVRALRERGLIRAPRPWIPVSWRIAAGIVALALFGSGVALGQRLDSSPPGAAGPMEAAVDLQQAGSAFVRAMATVAEVGQTDPASLAQAREAALVSFHTAAGEVARLAPDDPVVLHVLRGLQHDRERHVRVPEQEARHVFWF